MCFNTARGNIYTSMELRVTDLMGIFRKFSIQPLEPFNIPAMTQMSQTFRAASIAFAILLVSSAAWGQKSRPAGQPLPSGPADVENRVDSLLRLMTIEEKLGQLNQLSSVWDTVLHRSN